MYQADALQTVSARAINASEFFTSDKKLHEIAEAEIARASPGLHAEIKPLLAVIPTSLSTRLKNGERLTGAGCAI